jgi:hypothetical protein
MESATVGKGIVPSLKVPGASLDDVIGYFQLTQFFSRTLTLGLGQTLKEMNALNLLEY